MDRFQMTTKLDCPAHPHKKLIVVVTVKDNGDTDVWKGCDECDGNSRLKNEECEKPPSKSKSAEINSVKEMEVRVELLSFTTLFLVLGIILFSLNKIEVQFFGHNYSVSYMPVIMYTLGGISICFSITSTVLMYIPSIVEKFEYWTENFRRHLKIFRVVWAFLWFATVVTFVEAIVDTSNRLSDPNGRYFAFVGGTVLFIITAGKLIESGWRRSTSSSRQKVHSLPSQAFKRPI